MLKDQRAQLWVVLEDTHDLDEFSIGSTGLGKVVENFLFLLRRKLSQAGTLKLLLLTIFVFLPVILISILLLVLSVRR
jgi:hypothetical protein